MSCCGNNNRNFFSHNRGFCNDREDFDNDRCCNKRRNDDRCCDKRHNDDRCCDRRHDDNRCCDRRHDDDRCCDRRRDEDNLTGISCPFNNNNDCCCEDSLRDAACKLTNQRVIIHVDGCKMCVVIVGIGKCFLKTVNPCTQRIVYFNFNRIDNIEDVLPRCF